jgi:predicted AlkP superfamily phosphohydrolase/phosphomutase
VLDRSDENVAMNRVAAIGLDAGEWQLIERMMNDGQLPNLARLRQRSAECTLDNQAMYRSTLVWEAFLTGQEHANDPRSGGIEFDPSTYRVYKSGAGSGPLFYAESPDIKAIAFDVPHLSLSGEVPDVRVCTWGTHSFSHPRASRPDGLLREIDATFGTHPASAGEHLHACHRPQFVDWLTQALVDGSRRRIDIAHWLQRRFPDWELFLTVMSESHSAGENLWHAFDEAHPLFGAGIAEGHGARLYEVYRALDTAIGRFAEGLPPNTVLVVFSLHGTTSNDSELGSTVLLPELLHRLAFGRRRLKDPDQETWRRAPFVVRPALSENWDDYMRVHFGHGLAGRLRRTIRRRIPQKLVQIARALEDRHAGPSSDKATGRASLAWQVPYWYRSYWPRMRAFALPTFADARVRINLRERERQGIVDPDGYTAACAAAEDWVRACRDPRTGRAVVEEVWRPRAKDPMDPAGPDADLVIQWSRSFDALDHPKAGLIGPFPFRRTGAHTSRGFALFSGPGIRPANLGQHRAIDLPATLLALLGREPPPALHGRPILTCRETR